MSDLEPIPAPEPSAELTPQPAAPPVTTIPPGWLQDPQNPHLLRYWDGTAWTANTAPSNQAPAAPTTAVYAPRTVMASDKGNKAVQASIAWVIAVLTIGYMLPWAIAATRGKSNAGAIGLINLLLGWTLIGWIVALVMACGAHQTVAVSG